MSYDVVVTERAARDVDEIVSWLNERSPQGAARWVSRWVEVLDLLSHSAETFGLAPESSSCSGDIHQITFRTRAGNRYRALDQIEAGRVSILHVRGPGQRNVSANELA